MHGLWTCVEIQRGRSILRDPTFFLRSVLFTTICILFFSTLKNIFSFHYYSPTIYNYFSDANEGHAVRLLCALVRNTRVSIARQCLPCAVAAESCAWHCNTTPLSLIPGLRVGAGGVLHEVLPGVICAWAAALQQPDPCHVASCVH